MISFLVSTTKWPREACEAFWLWVRNPVMHTGRTSIFSEFVLADLVMLIGADETGAPGSEQHRPPGSALDHSPRRRGRF